MELVASKADIASNIAVFEDYRTNANPEHRADFVSRLRLGALFVYVENQGRFLFAPSRFVGYRQWTFEKHKAFPDKDGRVTTPQISKLLGKPRSDERAEAAHAALCRELGTEPAGKKRRYWALDTSDFTGNVRIPGGEFGFPDEVGEYVEGATRRVVINSQERNIHARRACLAFHGHKCTVCCFDFEENFGTIGKGFMHVHHLTPISTVSIARAVDPIADLTPLCPNCHAMIHMSDPPFSVEELREILRTSKDT